MWHFSPFHPILFTNILLLENSFDFIYYLILTFCRGIIKNCNWVLWFDSIVFLCFICVVSTFMSHAAAEFSDENNQSNDECDKNEKNIKVMISHKSKVLTSWMHVGCAVMSRDVLNPVDCGFQRSFRLIAITFWDYLCVLTISVERTWEYLENSVGEFLKISYFGLYKTSLSAQVKASSVRFW